MSAMPTNKKKTAKIKKKALARKRPAKPSAASHAMACADFGAPIDGFVAKQPPHLRAILEALRKLIEKTAPDAEASLKWGMPFYAIGGKMMCGTPAHKAHVNLILAGPPGAFDDPERILSGESKMGRHLKLTSLADLPPKATLRRWLATAAKVAREAGKD
jgi:hypothetical protein